MLSAIRTLLVALLNHLLELEGERAWWTSST
jgi:hypothetical protein